MAATSSTTAPTSGGASPPVRHTGPDLARGVMLLLIAMAYAGVYVGSAFGTVTPTDAPLPDRAAHGFAVLFLDNRAFPMFAILFGHGLAWSVRRRPEGARRLLRRRGWVLILFGFVHAFLVFPGEILISYGLATLLTGWLLLRSDRAVTIAMIIAVVGYLITVPLSMAGIAATDQTEAGVVGYTGLEAWLYRLSSVIISPVFIAIGYPLFLLVILGYAAARRRLLDDVAGRRIALRRIAVGGITISVLGAVPTALVQVGGWVPAVEVAGVMMAVQVLTGVAGGAGYAALFALLGDRLAERRSPRRGIVVGAVTAAGRSSLTCYLANSVAVALVLHPELLGRYVEVGAAGGQAIAVGVWLITTVVAFSWSRTGRTAPLDALMRRLVHRGEGQPA